MPLGLLEYVYSDYTTANGCILFACANKNAVEEKCRLSIPGDSVAERRAFVVLHIG